MPQERLGEQKKLIANKVLKSKKNTRVLDCASFKMTRKMVVTGLSIRRCLICIQMMSKKVTSALLELKYIRSKSGKSYNDEDVRNMMICLPCREKYCTDNKIKDVPSASDFDKKP